jgi:hypothetical protein
MNAITPCAEKFLSVPSDAMCAVQEARNLFKQFNISGFCNLSPVLHTRRKNKKAYRIEIMKTKNNPQSVMRKKANTEFDSYSQCASATGIPVSILRHAKKNGCPAFRFSKIYLFEFLQWHFTRKQPVDVIDVQEEQAKIIRLQRRKLEHDEMIAAETLVVRTDVEAEIWNALLPFRNALFQFAKMHRLETELDKIMAEHFERISPSKTI